MFIFLQGKQLENEGLGHQLAQLSRASEDLQKQSGALESELEETQRSLTGAQQECEALREANRDLRTLQEKFETVLRSKEEEVNQVRSEFSQRLESTQGEIRELEDMRNQLAAKEEIEENLVLERDGLAARLSAAEHQLATYQLLPSMEEQESKIRQMAEREGKLTRELKEQVGSCETLKAKLEEAQVALSETGQESARVKTARAQLQVEVRTLHDELQRKEVSLQNALMEKLSHERDLQSAHEELATLREQLDEASAERESAEAQRQEEEREEVDADERATEVERLTEEKALLTQQVDKALYAQDVLLHKMFTAVDLLDGIRTSNAALLPSLSPHLSPPPLFLSSSPSSLLLSPSFLLLLSSSFPFLSSPFSSLPSFLTVTPSSPTIFLFSALFFLP